MEMLVSSARYYKNKCMQQRSVLDRLKTELANYKALQRCVCEVLYSYSDPSICIYSRDNQTLRAEIDQLQRNMSQGPGDVMVSSNKRRRREDSQYMPFMPFFILGTALMNIARYLQNNRTSLSPRSVTTPIAPDRLTLGPDQRQSNFSSRQSTHALSDNTAQSHRDVRPPSDVERTIYARPIEYAAVNLV